MMHEYVKIRDRNNRSRNTTNSKGFRSTKLAFVTKMCIVTAKTNSLLEIKITKKTKNTTVTPSMKTYANNINSNLSSSSSNRHHHRSASGNNFWPTTKRAMSLWALLMTLLMLPRGLTESIDFPYTVEATPVLHSIMPDLTTVLILNKQKNLGRYLNVRPEVGLLTSTARTFIQEGVTTEYATQVVGTTLENGRLYAQYLKKSSRVLYANDHHRDQSITQPSVVTSWVGKASNDVSSPRTRELPPQSHNDLLNAEQPDWQDIDDRNFVGNTDFVGLSELNYRKDVTTAILPSAEEESEGVSDDLGNSFFSYHNREDGDVAIANGSVYDLVLTNTRKVSAKKVLPIGDLPTYTVKHHFTTGSAVTASGSGNNNVNIDVANDDDVLNRTPKVYYKQLTPTAVATATNKTLSNDWRRPQIQRWVFTTTYYGFSDFTTLVGDTLIIFSPRTIQQNVAFGQVTSINGEATLGQRAKIQDVPNVTIGITQDLTTPTYTEAPQLSSLLATHLSFLNPAVTEESQLQSPPMEMLATMSLDHQEGLPTTARATILASESITMLSRPSDQEILEIFLSLSRAEEARKTSEAMSVATIQTNDPTNVQITHTHTAANAGVNTSATSVDGVIGSTNGIESTESGSFNLQSTNTMSLVNTPLLTAGATTIFFEDGPFSNFIELTTTAVVTTYAAAATEAITSYDELTLDKTGLLVNFKDFERTKNNFVEVNCTEITADENIFDNKMPEDCSRTSEIFLTQLPELLTVYTKHKLSEEAILESSSVPTFGIIKAKKHHFTQSTDIATIQINEDYNTAPEQVPEETATGAITTTSEQEQNILDTTLHLKNKSSSELLTTVEEKEEEPEPEDVTTTIGTMLRKTNYDGNDYEDSSTSSTPSIAVGRTGILRNGHEDDEGEGEEEIELIYKTLYTTYTYLTTFFRDEDSTSISSRTEVMTNVITSTVGIFSNASDSISTVLEDDPSSAIHTLTVGDELHMIDATQIMPTRIQQRQQKEVEERTTTTKFIVPSELESIIRNDAVALPSVDRGIVKPKETNLLPQGDCTEESKCIKTYYTTYTYFTTIFTDGETEIMSHTEVYSNLVSNTATDIQANRVSNESTVVTLVSGEFPAVETSKNVEELIINTTVYDKENAVLDLIPTGTTGSMAEILSSSSNALAAIERELETPPILNDYSKMTLITDIRSSSSNSEQQIIKGYSGNIIDQMRKDVETLENLTTHVPPDDQISSESNNDEILPSETLLLQTSFTTFTYYTTVYSMEHTNVISRLETITNIVTETLKPTPAISLENHVDDVSLPITYFTTYTYWTKLSKNGEIVTLSREETISNMVTPTAKPTLINASPVSIKATTLLNERTTIFVTPSITTEAMFDHASSTGIINSSLDLTTYFTTYTFYTTSYDADNTITDSRFETITNVVTPVLNVTTINGASVMTAVVTQLLDTFSKVIQQPVEAPSPESSNGFNVILYDYRRIIDSDGISTLHFTTQVLPTIGIDGSRTELVSSTSTLYIDELKKALLSTKTATYADILGGGDSGGGDSAMTTSSRQYKTGLVRLIEGTRIGNYTTTLYQSKVIGTFIDNRYAQIIESTSSFLFEKVPGVTVTASSTTDIYIKPSTTQSLQIAATGPVQTALNASPANIESSFDGSTINSNLLSTSSPKEDVANNEEKHDEDGYEDDDKYIPGENPMKKRKFTPVIRPFASRSRPQFAPKKKNLTQSSATIITRSDFTPTITATPALKSVGTQFGSSRRSGGISSSIGGPSPQSSRRFSRPSSKFSTSGQSSGIGGSSRSHLQSTVRLNSGLASNLKRLGGPSGGYRPGLSSSYVGSSRNRIKPTDSLSVPGSSKANSPTDNLSTLIPANLSEEELNRAQEQLNDGDDVYEDDATIGQTTTTENSRRNQNPLLRFRRPLVNRPSGFQPNPAGQKPSSSASSQRKNPLATSKSNTATASSTASTTTTSRPRPRSFQRPATLTVRNSGGRPQNSLFPPRTLFQAQQQPDDSSYSKRTEDYNVFAVDASESDDDSEYEDDDEDDDDVETGGGIETRSNGTVGVENPRSRRSNGKNSAIFMKPRRIKREAEASAAQAVATRTNIRNRFKRPKGDVTAAQYKPEEHRDEPIETTSSSIKPRTRVNARFGTRKAALSGTTSTAAATAYRSNTNIRPTRPTKGRAQFTLREKDAISTISTHSVTKTGGSVRQSGSNFRRSQQNSGISLHSLSGGGSNGRNRVSLPRVSSRRLKGSVGKSGVNSDFSGGNIDNSNGRSSLQRTRKGGLSNSIGRRRQSLSPASPSSASGRSRQRQEDNAEVVLPEFDGTITVTHEIPAEVTIPVVNGQLTEYKSVVTARTSTEIVDPQQYTSFVNTNGQTLLALTREESSVNYAGATEITQFLLHESSTTTVIFTPTTIRGRQTSFSHIIPSTVYSVESVVSTIQPQIAANAPLANILLSQLLLGNIGLPGAVGANHLLGAALGVAGTVGLQIPGVTAISAMPLTEFRTHTSTYVTTLFEGMSTILPITFQGKKILTTIFDTTAQTITATEFITDTIVTTPTQQQQAGVNSLLLQQLLLQQQQQLQLQQTQMPILHSQSLPTPSLLSSTDNLQDLDTSNNNNNLRHALAIGDDIDNLSTPSLLDNSVGSIYKSGRKKSRKSGKFPHKRNKQQSNPQESSVITLYVSGRRPGEFSTVLSTVESGDSSGTATLHKRAAPDGTSMFPTTLVTANYASDYHVSDGSEQISEYLLPDGLLVFHVEHNNDNDADNYFGSNVAINLPEMTHNLLDVDVDVLKSNVPDDREWKIDFNIDNYEQNERNKMVFAGTITLESVVGDVSSWYNRQATIDTYQQYTQHLIKESTTPTVYRSVIRSNSDTEHNGDNSSSSSSNSSNSSNCCKNNKSDIFEATPHFLL